VFAYNRNDVRWMSIQMIVFSNNVRWTFREFLGGIPASSHVNSVERDHWALCVCMVAVEINDRNTAEQTDVDAGEAIDEESVDGS